MFLDSPVSNAAPVETFAGSTQGLVFVLSGLSKLAALPQTKLTWIALSGDPESRKEASLRLEHIADSYLSVGTPAPAVTLPIPEGGWYASLRVPAARHSEEWALLLLEQESVYIHPGSSFGFAVEAYLVLSLLTPEDAFDDGVRRILRAARRE